MFLADSYPGDPQPPEQLDEIKELSGAGETLGSVNVKKPAQIFFGQIGEIIDGGRG